MADRRVGIVTINDDTNYGNRLQNFALQEAIRSLGHEPETLVNRPPAWDRALLAPRMAHEIRHDVAAQQFRVESNGASAELQYRRDPDSITFLHTEVPEAWRGQGIAQKLAHAGLEYAKREKLHVIPLCPYVNAYIKRHPEYRPLVKAY